MTDVPLSAQLINLFASVILLLAFAMLAAMLFPAVVDE